MEIELIRNNGAESRPSSPPSAKINSAAMHKPMTVRTDHNQVGTVVVVVIAIKVMYIHLSVMLGLEATVGTRRHQLIDREERTM